MRFYYFNGQKISQIQTVLLEVAARQVIRQSFTTDLVTLTTVDPLPNVVIHSSVKSIFRQYIAVSNGLLELFKPLSYLVSLVECAQQPPGFNFFCLNLRLSFHQLLEKKN